MSKITASNVHIYPAREQTSCMIFSLTVTNRLGFFIGQRCVLPTKVNLKIEERCPTSFEWAYCQFYEPDEHEKGTIK